MITPSQARSLVEDHRVLQADLVVAHDAIREAAEAGYRTVRIPYRSDWPQHRPHRVREALAAEGWDTRVHLQVTSEVGVVGKTTRRWLEVSW